MQVNNQSSSLTTFRVPIPDGLKLTGLPGTSPSQREFSNANATCGGGEAFPLIYLSSDSVFGLVCDLDSEVKNGAIDPVDVLGLLELAAIDSEPTLVAVEYPTAGIGC